MTGSCFAAASASYNAGMIAPAQSGRSLVVLFAAVLLAVPLAAATQQPPVPRPFPQPSEPTGQPPATEPTPTQEPPQAPVKPGQSPTEATLGVPIYPTAQFLASYDAGRGQRYYLFGAPARFAEVVAYYKTVLKQKGDLLFEEPPTQTFDIGRFREETMAFPPSVTVKDYTWGGSEGYLNPKPGGQPARFETVIQIVPVPAPTAGQGQQSRR